jgi:hypothetical protein
VALAAIGVAAAAIGTGAALAWAAITAERRAAAARESAAVAAGETKAAGVEIELRNERIAAMQTASEADDRYIATLEVMLDEHEAKAPAPGTGSAVLRRGLREVAAAVRARARSLPATAGTDPDRVPGNARPGTADGGPRVGAGVPGGDAR